jgi:hypothetical protein
MFTYARKCLQQVTVVSRALGRCSAADTPLWVTRATKELDSAEAAGGRPREPKEYIIYLGTCEYSQLEYRFRNGLIEFQSRAGDWMPSRSMEEPQKVDKNVHRWVHEQLCKALGISRTVEQCESLSMAEQIRSLQEKNAALKSRLAAILDTI